MRKLSLLLVHAAVIACLLGCSPGAPENTQGQNMPGSDKDAHGCVASAGYSWCESTNQCERPWELAEKEGFENTPEGFREFCQKP